MKKVRYKFVYNRKNELNAEGKSLVQLRINYKGVSRYFSTQIYLMPIEWNSNKGELSQKCTNYNEYDIYLNMYLNKFKEFEIWLLRENKEFSFDLLKEYLNNGSELDNSFINFCKTEYENSIISNQTKKHQKVLFRALDVYSDESDQVIPVKVATPILRQ